jgi:hypothetical protein
MADHESAMHRPGNSPSAISDTDEFPGKGSIPYDAKTHTPPCCCHAACAIDGNFVFSQYPEKQ